MYLYLFCTLFDDLCKKTSFTQFAKPRFCAATRLLVVAGAFVDTFRNKRKVVCHTFDVANKVYKHTVAFRVAFTLVKAFEVLCHKLFTRAVDFFLGALDVGKFALVLCQETVHCNVVHVAHFVVHFLNLAVHDVSKGNLSVRDLACIFADVG